MANVLLTLLLVSLTLTAANCQTFQYSRGWTNGKRAETNPAIGRTGYQSQFKIANFPIQDFGGQSSEIVAPSMSTHCSLQKLKMLLQGNGNDQLYLLPCELLGSLQSSYEHHQQQEILPAVGHYRRTPSTVYDSVNNNY